MASFEIKLEDGSELFYFTDPSLLCDKVGAKVDLSKFAYSYVQAPFPDKQIAFSPENPVVGKDAPRLLKIQLGLGCNYSCSYCSQGGQKEESTSTADAENFSLDWVEGTPDKVEFWGGEPMLYWKKLVTLVEKVDIKWPGIRKSVITNGTLLTKERVDWLFDHGFTVGVSHDGPGQALRGEDPLEDMEMRSLWRYLFEKFGERASINSVMTAKNFDMFKMLMWFEERIGAVKMNIEDIVTDYGGGKMSDEELQQVYESVKKYASSGLALVFPRVRFSVQQFMETLAIAKPLAGSNQVCGMDRKDQIAVDLNGNVLTCQNAGADSGHKIGSVSALDAVTLDTSTSFMNRPNCKECPVVHLCYGSCMFLAGEDFESSCRSSYWYNRAIVEGAIKLLTGKEVSTISGWKPAPAKRVIPIKVASC